MNAGLPKEAAATLGLVVQAAQSITDGGSLASTLVSIAKAPAAAGLNGEADATLDKALRTARSVEETATFDQAHLVSTFDQE
jgi:hypothetical protein